MVHQVFVVNQESAWSLWMKLDRHSPLLCSDNKDSILSCWLKTLAKMPSTFAKPNCQISIPRKPLWKKLLRPCHKMLTPIRHAIPCDRFTSLGSAIKAVNALNTLLTRKNVFSFHTKMTVWNALYEPSCKLFFCFHWPLGPEAKVEVDGLEPTTLGLQSRCSPNWAIPPWVS